MASDVLTLDGRHTSTFVGEAASILADPSGVITLDEARSALANGAFVANGRTHFDVGYSITPHWIAIPIKSTASLETQYLLSTNVPLVPALSVVLLRRDGLVERLLDKRTDTAWSEKLFFGQSVVSEEFTLAPGEQAMLLARFQPYGIGVLPLSIETTLSAFIQVAATKQVIAAFYSYAITSLVLLLLIILALWHPGGLHIVVLFASGLVMMLQLDGLLNQWLWPNWPQWNKIASFPMLLALCSAGFRTAQFMLRDDMPRVAFVSRCFSLLCFAPLCLTPFIEVAWLILPGFVLMVLAFGLLSFAIINWARLLPGKTRLAVAIGTVLFASMAFIIFDVVTARSDLSAQNLLLVKVLYVIITLIVLLSYATHVAAMNQERAAAMSNELNLARKEAETSAQLLASERRYARARDLVAAQRNRLATASHDLRQPIASLRLTLDSLAKKMDGKMDPNIARSFEYLDELVRSNLTEAHQTELVGEISPAPLESEILPASLIVGPVAQMFNDEARDKGIRLKAFESSLSMTAPPMPVMRIVSNLVSNAVKHTDAGGVLLGARARADRVAIEVYDTGPGMTEAAIRELSEKYKKGSSSEGEGLGLSICHELAALHGFELNVRSVVGSGTRCTLLVPSADHSQV